MEQQKPVILVIMHHTTDGNYQTAGRRWSEEYPNVQLGVDVLFHATKKGLLKCDINKKAVKDLSKLITQIKQ